MILTCPSCSASYHVANQDIGIEGRKVRCKKCLHVWFHAGEKKALEDIITRIQETDIDVDGLIFGDSKSVAPQKSEGISWLSSIKHIILLPISIFNKNNRAVAGAAVGLACFALICAGLVIGKHSVMAMYPSSESTYVMLGLHKPLPFINPEEAIIIDKPEIVGDSTSLKIRGSIINLASQDVALPSFSVTLLDGQKAELHKFDYTSEQKFLAKESAIPLEITIPEDIYKDIENKDFAEAIIKFSKP
jgi:predicted Zn finger-like uncharacterized protein